MQVATVHHLCLYCHRIALNVLYIGQQLELYLALLSCSLCSLKLHVVLLFEQVKKEGRREGS